ncbi:MATE family efflux transporter [Corynebacterium sp. 153RC1]|uniref:MATE family efflux transporter n=1 Tax=unclassified Corynebacterium TaxID=2624378 RepID=UPI00211C7103|nr:MULTISPECIES: MATE family efflux transporter [unclassified Corynebacterium]MCQ9371016.1 MATE family efflux transporter [Corynebacterium sp. 35RC1]MCQ9351599.1 MATE family efflux transporter [Corynebacterium sp. 209RC1]MCQ9353968.1 MATE family efflux transporter [Corynebacterium sp. 1222RC1]MCQ9355882.1 MATE family efflux transporter [Corynebacterium sp. 122RC1]MCQ9358126.1 MATE family efflux transporter [Corynebacterium sp. 142RC1]
MRQPKVSHPNNQPESASKVSAWTILALSLPTLGVLAATPLFLLLDTAMVGRVGGGALAALGAGSVIYAQVTTQLTFLSYGTTARASRLFGAGKPEAAVAEGLQATWLAGLVGSALTLLLWVGAPWFAGLLAGAGASEVAAQATSWLRVVAFGIPFVLAAMAGNGWLRGIQETTLPLVFTLAGVLPGAVAVVLLVNRYGLIGSAWATLLGEIITGSLFVAALARFHKGSWRPQPKVWKQQLILGRDLVLRSLSFQVSFLSAAAVAGRIGPEALGGHQVLMQLWNFLALVLDSLAIAAQTLVGAALGSGSVALARALGVKVTRYSVAFSLVLAGALAAGAQVVPRWFTSDTQVLGAIGETWWLLVGLIVIGGVVFALDGVLLGAGDAVFLRNATMLSAVCGIVPGVWLAYFLGTGLAGVWWGIVAFLLLRLAAVVWRFQSMRWARVGD